MENRIYLAINLKSFYASVECMERGIDPMTTNLVVADESRPKRPFALPFRPLSNLTGSPADRDCLGCAKNQRGKRRSTAQSSRQSFCRILLRLQCIKNPLRSYR